MIDDDLTCMFCNKPIKDNQEYISSPVHDGTDAHISCGDEAVSRYWMTHLK